MDPYQILHVSPGSSPEDIERAFRVAVHRTHPNNGGDPAMFAAVLDAYRTLNDPGRKSTLDANRPLVRSSLSVEGTPVQSTEGAVVPSRQGTPRGSVLPSPKVGAAKRRSGKNHGTRLAAFFIGLALPLPAGILVGGIPPSPPTIAVCVLVAVLAAVAAPLALIAAQRTSGQLVLGICCVGIVVWPTIFGLVVGLGLFAGMFFVVPLLARRSGPIGVRNG